jgi:hypothetical protein
MVEWTAEIAEWQNTKRQATIANLISSRDYMCAEPSYCIVGDIRT